jgi:UDP-glucose 4-epimerase
MEKAGIKILVFSSSATVYKESKVQPLTENMPLGTTNPYGASKLMVEDICRDLEVADNLSGSRDPWRISLLRYFNPVGAHESGLIGEDPKGIPNNLMPYISQVAIGKLPSLSVFGGDYPTIDGTGVRDYIHVVDLAKGHVKAVQAMLEGLNGVNAINLGSGAGLSVKQLIKTFEIENNIEIPFKIVQRRAGDIAEYFGCADKAKLLLSWQTELDVFAMVKDSWNWQSKNPNGYE